MPSAYQSRPYDDRGASARMSDLMREAGAVQARGIQERGQNTAALVGRMGDLITGVADSYVAAKKEQEAATKAKAVEAEQERIKQIVRESVDPATGRLDFDDAARKIGQFNPMEAEKFWDQATERQREDAAKEAAQAEQVAKGLGTVLLAAQQDASKASVAYTTWRADALKRKLIEPDEFPEQYDEVAVQQQALFKYLPADAVFKQLFSAKNAPQRSTKVVNDKIVDDQTGEVVYEGESKPRGQVVETTDARGNPVRRFVTEDELAKGVPVYKAPTKGPETGPTPAAIQRARDNRFNRMTALREAVDKGLDAGKAEQAAYEIEREYAAATGGPEPPAPRQFPADMVASGNPTEDDPLAKRGGGGPSMRDLVQPQPAPRQAPLGAAPANAAPANQPAPEIARALQAEGPGEYDLQDGTTWRVYPDGRMERVK